MLAAPERPSWRAYLRVTTILIILVHLAVVAGVAWFGWSWQGLALALGVYYLRMIVVTAGYHRYFAHRSFSTSRVFQFLLAVAAQTSGQKGALWWASHHRWHHKHSDDALDLHSVRQRGFWYAHIGWLFAGTFNETDLKGVPDLARFPELRWLDRAPFQLAPTFALGLGFLLLGGLHGLLWGFFVSTVMLWHGSFAINSFAHLFGRRRYATNDDSRNHWLLALITCGEGWHNNHHHYAGSARQGFFWWEIDLTYYVLRGLAAMGLVWNLRQAPPDVLAATLTRLPGSASVPALGHPAADVSSSAFGRGRAEISAFKNTADDSM